MSDLTPDAAALPALERERRALLGDARSVDRLSGDEMRRFVALCQDIRTAHVAAGTLQRRTAARQRGALDLADL